MHMNQMHPEVDVDIKPIINTNYVKKRMQCPNCKNYFLTYRGLQMHLKRRESCGSALLNHALAHFQSMMQPGKESEMAKKTATAKRVLDQGKRLGFSCTTALWCGTNKNQDVSTGPLSRPFARSLSRSWESELLMSQNDLVLSHSALLAKFRLGLNLRERKLLKWFPLTTI